MTPAKGELLLAECDGNPVHDESGELRMIVLVSRNLSARARAEVDLRLAASAYDRLDDAILICDGAGRIEFVNKAYTRLTGYAPGTSSGTTSTPAEADCRRNACSGTSWNRSVRTRRGRGTTRSAARTASWCCFPRACSACWMNTGRWSIPSGPSTARRPRCNQPESGADSCGIAERRSKRKIRG